MKTRQAIIVVVTLLTLSRPGAGPARTAEPVRLQPAPEKPPARTDRYGDPLPEGAVARLGTVRLRHENAEGISAVVFCPDGKSLLSAGRGRGRSGRQPRHLRLWELATGKQIRRFGASDGEDLQWWVDNHEWGYSTVALSADGRLVAAAGQSRMELWNLTTGKRLRRTLGSFSAVAVSPDGKLLATAEEDKGVRIRDVATNKTVVHVRSTEKQINELTFSPDGCKLLADTRGTLCLWDIATGREQHRWQHGRLVATAFSRDGKQLATADDGCMVRYWDLESGKEVFSVLLRPKDMVAYVGAFSPDLRILALVHDGGQIHIWHVRSGKQLQVFPGHVPRVECLAFSSDGKLLASGGSDCTVRLWDVVKNQERLPLPGHRCVVESVAISSDGKLLASGSSDGTTRLWRPGTGEDLGLFQQMPWSVHAVSLSPDGKLLAVAGEDATFSVWDVGTKEEVRQFPGQHGSLYSVAFSPDGKEVATGNTDGTVRLWNLASGKLMRRIPAAERDVGMASAVFSPDGRILATVHRGRTVRLWDSRTGTLLGKLVGSQRYCVTTLRFAPDGRTLAATGDDRAVYLWDVATRQELPQFLPHRAMSLFGNSVIAFSPDGRLLATAGLCEPVNIWEVATGERVRTFDAGYGGPSDQTWALAFSPDGRTLASAGNGDFAILMWDMTGLLSEGRLPALKLFPRQLSDLWADLAGAEAPAGYQAIWRLAAGGAASVAYLRERLHPVSAPDARHVARLLDKLNDDRFAVRDRATRDLEDLGDVIEPALRRALTRRESLEFRRRVEQLLDRLRPTTPGRLRENRAVAVLERMEDPSARRLLERLAGGASHARLTREAKAALERLERRAAE
jgi:WD40 repeat protein